QMGQGLSNFTGALTRARPSLGKPITANRSTGGPWQFQQSLPRLPMFQCSTITNFLFGTSFDQLSFPDFRGDIVEGVDVAMPTITLRTISSVFAEILHNIPPSILMVISLRSMKGLIVFKKVSLSV
ncbi:hypothetical protein BC826DRAFT_1086754, partial [Russula brevipes]